MTIDALAPADAPEVERLLDAAFGPARKSRTAYRLRDGQPPIGSMSFAARRHGRLVGAVQCWPVLLGARDGRDWPLTLLGPVVVDAAHRGAGLGAALVDAALAALGEAPVMLIGDAPYYGRFGFSAERTGGWQLPGPVEADRLLARRAETLPLHGMVRAADPVRHAA